MSYLYRTGDGRNDIGYTTTISSSIKYLCRTSTGINDISFIIIPGGSTYSILQRTGTGRNNIAWANLNVPIPKGSQTFTSSGIFTVPAGVTLIQVFCVGGGGGGNMQSGGTGGGGGGYTTTSTMAVTPGQTISVVIGAGGRNVVPGRLSSTPAQPGGTTSFGSISAAGGKEGGDISVMRGGNGGSGGGNGGISGEAGGRDGGNGGTNNSDRTPGYGQGRTTRAFGESSGTLYSNGGYGAINGSGRASNQSANTGNGGNGVGTRYDSYPGGTGGSGIVIVRWGY